jgi:molybdate transport system ATP-binding protein
VSIEARFLLRRPLPGGGADAAAAEHFALDVDLRLPAEGVGIVGASGSGKTTLLRCIAGLERPELLPVHRRAIGYVFQEASLFPHLSTRDNLRFGFERVPAHARKVTFDSAVALLGIGPLLSRRTHNLSGGERQRVAIARALLTSPSLLLLDEPVASLDLASRAQILDYLEAVQRELAVPLLYVSHVPAEVARIADHAALLEHGKALASGALNDVFTNPALPLSRREDAAAVLEAQVERHDDAHHLTHLRVAGGSLSVSRRALPTGARTKVQIHARDVSLSLVAPTHSSIVNVLSVRVRAIHPEADPAHRLIELDLAGQTMLARITGWSVEQLGIRPEVQAFAQIKGVALVT